MMNADMSKENNINYAKMGVAVPKRENSLSNIQHYQEGGADSATGCSL